MRLFLSANSSRVRTTPQPRQSLSSHTRHYRTSVLTHFVSFLFAALPPLRRRGEPPKVCKWPSDSPDGTDRQRTSTVGVLPSRAIVPYSGGQNALAVAAGVP